MRNHWAIELTLNAYAYSVYQATVCRQESRLVKLQLALGTLSKAHNYYNHELQLETNVKLGVNLPLSDLILFYISSKGLLICCILQLNQLTCLLQSLNNNICRHYQYRYTKAYMEFQKKLHLVRLFKRLGSSITTLEQESIMSCQCLHLYVLLPLCIHMAVANTVAGMVSAFHFKAQHQLLLISTTLASQLLGTLHCT